MSNESDCDIPETLPTIFEFFEGQTSTQTILVATGSGLTVGLIVLGLIHLYYVWKFVGEERKRNKLYVVCLLYPILAILSVAGMISPRSAPIMMSFGVLVILFALYSVVSLKSIIYGGRDELTEVLVDDNRELSLRAPPFCCCCPCLPTLQPSAKNILILERLVLQAVLVRVVVEFICVFLLAEMGQKANMLILLIDLVVIPSVLLAIFGAHVMSKLTTRYLDTQRYMALFRFVDLTFPLFTAQFPLFFEAIFMRLGWFSCGTMLSPTDNAKFMFFFVFLCQLFLMSILATVMMAPEKSTLLDRFHKGKALPLHSPTEMTTMKR